MKNEQEIRERMELYAKPKFTGIAKEEQDLVIDVLKWVLE